MEPLINEDQIARIRGTPPQGTRGAQSRLLDLVGIDEPIEMVAGLPSIVACNVISTAAAVLDEQMVLAGRIPSVEELRQVVIGVSP